MSEQPAIVPTPDTWADDMRDFVDQIPDEAHVADRALSPIITQATRCILESATQIDILRTRLKRMEHLVEKYHYPTRPVDCGADWPDCDQILAEHPNELFCHMCKTLWPCEHVLAFGQSVLPNPAPVGPAAQEERSREGSDRTTGGAEASGVPPARDGRSAEARSPENA